MKALLVILAVKKTADEPINIHAAIFWITLAGWLVGSSYYLLQG